MKINNGMNVNRIMKKYNNSVKKTDKTKKSDGLKKDQLNISKSAKEFQVAMKEAKNTPDIRRAKVDEIKQKIDDGTYNPSAKDIAKKMVSNAILNK